MTALQELTQAISDIKSAIDNVVNGLRQAAAAPTPTPDTISASDAHEAASQLEAVATQLNGVLTQTLPASNASAQPAQPVSGAGDGTTQPASPAPVTPENPTGT